MEFSDFDSGLTSLSDTSSDSDSDADKPWVPVQKKATKKQPAKPRKLKEKNDYTIQSNLRPYRMTTYATKALYDQIMENQILLDPDYQRDVVWSDAKQVGLIDSLLRNYFVPPVIFAVTYNDDGGETKTCIDGKQRLTSIQRFLNGEIAHKDNLTGKKYWYKDVAGSKRTLLPQAIRSSFSNKQIACVEYDHITNELEREIFQRVQLGVALTHAERMQAIPGPWPSLIRDISSTVLGEDGFGEDLDWGRARGRDFQCLASIVYLIDQHPASDFPGAAALEKWLATAEPVPGKLREDIHETFKIFLALVKDARYNSPFKKPTRVSPIEFTMTGMLIHFRKAKFSMAKLSSAITLMRADVRRKHTDIRANRRIATTMFTFLKEGIDRSTLKGDGKGDIPASTALKSPRTVTQKVAPRQVKKRRIDDSESGSDQDISPKKVPPKKTATITRTTTATGSAPKARNTQAAKPSSSKKVVRKTVATKPPTGKPAGSTTLAARDAPVSAAKQTAGGSRPVQSTGGALATSSGAVPRFTKVSSKAGPPKSTSQDIAAPSTLHQAETKPSSSAGGKSVSREVHTAGAPVVQPPTVPVPPEAPPEPVVKVSLGDANDKMAVDVPVNPPTPPLTASSAGRSRNSTPRPAPDNPAPTAVAGPVNGPNADPVDATPTPGGLSRDSPPAVILRMPPVKTDFMTGSSGPRRFEEMLAKVKQTAALAKLGPNATPTQSAQNSPVPPLAPPPPSMLPPPLPGTPTTPSQIPPASIPLSSTSSSSSPSRPFPNPQSPLFSHAPPHVLPAHSPALSSQHPPFTVSPKEKFDHTLAPLSRTSTSTMMARSSTMEPDPRVPTGPRKDREREDLNRRASTRNTPAPDKRGESPRSRRGPSRERSVDRYRRRTRSRSRDRDDGRSTDYSRYRERERSVDYRSERDYDWDRRRHRASDPYGRDYSRQ